jgi:hypothetical protein
MKTQCLHYKNQVVSAIQEKDMLLQETYDPHRLCGQKAVFSAQTGDTYSN